MTSTAILDRAVVRVAGPDAEKLLRDTLTGRIDDAMGLEGRWTALLSPQGKVLAEGLVTFAAGAYWFDLPRAAAPDFIKRMSLYRLRAKAEIADASADHVVWWTDDAHAGAPPVPDAIAYLDTRTIGLGTRYIVPRADVVPIAAGSVAFEAARIGHGIPEMGADFPPGEVFAHDIGLDILNGIDFVKGCYVGQEVVSRMKHRGTARRRPVIVSGAALTPGAAIVASGRESGTVGAVHEGRAVAIVRLDRIADPSAVTVGDAPATLALPAWATYAFGESAGAED